MSQVSSVAFMVVISLAVFLGMFSFMSDLETKGYNISATNISGSEDTVNQLVTDMNDTSVNLQDALTGEQSWTQTAYNIFFALPNTIASTISTITNAGAKMISITTGTDSSIPTPDWVMPIAFLAIGLVIVFGLIYLVTGRNL